MLRLRGCVCFVVFPFKLHGLGLDGAVAIWLEELLMNVCLQGHSAVYRNCVLERRLK